jgi:Ca2+-binding RTX toxin-like protein
MVSPTYRLTGGRIKIQVEDLLGTDPTGGWVYQAPGAGNAGAEGAHYYYLSETEQGSKGFVPGAGRFGFSLEVPDDGSYRILLRAARDSNDPGDARNDIWIRVDGDTQAVMPTGTPELISVGGGFTKYKGAQTAWTNARIFSAAAEEDPSPPSDVVLDKGLHTISFAPRSIGLHVDSLQIIRVGPSDPVPLAGTAAADLIRGGGSRDAIDGLGGDDRLLGRNAGDSLIGGAGSDRIWGQDGEDQLLGNTGNDRLFGGAGADRLRGHGGNDRLDGNAGDDSLFGAVGEDLLLGGAGADALWGEDGDDRLFGQAGADRLAGNRGVDRLRGQAGDDTLTGGADADRFVFDAGADVITDFAAGEDRADLRAIPNLAGFAELAHHATEVGADLVLRFGADSLTLLDTRLAALGADDFLL